MKNINKRLSFLMWVFASLIFLYTCKELEKSMLVSTGEVTNITANSADVSGMIVDLGGGATKHGHCYSKTPNVTTSSTKTDLGTPSGNGGFTSQLKNLEAGTLYYIKAYISDGTETVYGKEISFTTTAASLPVISTTAITAITTTTATSGGNITGDGGSPVIARGVCWNIATGPSTSNSKTTDGSGTGSFSSSLTGLSANTKYYLRAYATNSAGTAYGNEFDFTTNSVSLTAPGAPTIGTATAGNTQASVTFTPPANNGGSPITGYTVTSNPGNITGTGAASPITVTGLTNGTAYSFTVTATNAIGTGPASAASNTVTPVSPTTVPGAPTIGTATAENAQATITFTAPASNGGSVITSYTATSSPGGLTGTGVTSPITVIGLTNGIAYTFTVTATNANGTGPASSASNSVTPCIAPSATSDAPTAIGTATATINGTVNAFGLSTVVTFEWGLTTAYGSIVTAIQSPITGNTNTAVSAGLNGLSSNTTYHYRVKSVNCGGTTYGSDQSFTTGCVAPLANSQTATDIMPTTVKLNGFVNANGNSTDVTFEYGTTTSYGNIINATPGNVTGNSNTAVIANVTGLMPGTTYHFMVKAVNCGGASVGNDLTFTTPCASPVTTTDAATSIGNSSATLNGTVNANFTSTVVTFEYGTSVSYGSTATATQSPVTGNTNTAVSSGITGLSASTLYHYRVKAVNCWGTIYGIDQTFTTLCLAPVATINAATNINPTSVTLNGSVNANGFSTIVTFEYGTTTSFGSTITATQSPLTGSSNTPVSASLPGLLPNTIYHCRVKAMSCGGTIYSSDLPFSTSCPAPTAATNAASGIGTSSATLNGTVNASGFSTTVTFEYGTTTSYGSTVNASQSPVSGTINSAVSSGITGLSPNTLYHFRVKSVNCGGTIYGSDQTLTSLCATPTVTTGSVTSLSNTTVTLNGTINANNGSTTVTFEYGLTTGYGSSVTAAQSPVSGTTNVAVSAAVINLTQKTLYHYRIKGVNCGGTTYGSDQTFTTALCPLSLSLTHISGTTAAVSKSVVYGVIESSLSGASKCWITRNLGASSQATSVNDDTESAAGWYWQFNRRQGYKHDGTTRTPSTGWLGWIDESSNWSASEDPCTILLGTGWRLPTYSEWVNVDNNGAWSSSSNAYSSVLKLHTAGFINIDGTTLMDRSSNFGGYYLSSYQNSTTWGWHLSTNVGFSGVTGSAKSYGYSVRCIRD